MEESSTMICVVGVFQAHKDVQWIHLIMSYNTLYLPYMQWLTLFTGLMNSVNPYRMIHRYVHCIILYVTL
jgi:hypothetical protein